MITRPGNDVETVPPAVARGWLSGSVSIVPTTKGGALYKAIREAIVSAQLPPGSPLNARALAGQIGVSVIPIREALHRLAAEGLVTIRPHVGAFVTELPTDRLIEYLEIRLMLECFAIEKALAAMVDSDLRVLQGLVSDLDADLAASNWTAYAQHNRSFHRAIYSLSRNTVLTDEIDRLFALSERGQALFALEPTYAEQSQAEHRELMEAIRAKDGKRATSVMTRHRRRNMDGLRRMAAISSEPVPNRSLQEEGV